MKAFDLITKEFVNYVSYNAINETHEIRIGSTYLNRRPGDIILLKDADENMNTLELAQKKYMKPYQSIYIKNAKDGKMYYATIRPRGFTDNDYPFTEMPVDYTNYINGLKSLFDANCIFTKKAATAKGEGQSTIQLTLNGIIGRLDEN